VNEIIIGSAAVLGALGLVFGALLAVASRFFGVTADSRVIQVRENLPGANCGGCGYAGCNAFAEAIVSGDAPVNGCPVNSADGAQRIASIMGVACDDVEPLVAMVRCRGTLANTHIKYEYEGITDCAAAAALAEGYKACRFSCLGLGNCTRVCPTGAVTVVNGLATIDHDRCITCGKCVAACPRHIIHLVPTSAGAVVLCSANAKGKTVREACDVGCIGCGICARVCRFGAIKMVDDLPVIDYDRCTGCNECVEKCPRDAIRGREGSRKVAFIHGEECVGCTLCAAECKFDAIEGEPKTIHTVTPDKCTGCNQCVDVCPQEAITLIDKD
jgi:electron transport complex protein RnfB